ncbi:MAG: hypothetical protein HY540_04690 [Deltaproteobacteria bacterium]|nr:hypothetical protein [Deltaproteobacteria bacterium]
MAIGNLLQTLKTAIENDGCIDEKELAAIENSYLANVEAGTIGDKAAIKDNWDAVTYLLKNFSKAGVDGNTSKSAPQFWKFFGEVDNYVHGSGKKPSLYPEDTTLSLADEVRSMIQANTLTTISVNQILPSLVRATKEDRTNAAFVLLVKGVEPKTLKGLSDAPEWNKFVKEYALLCRQNGDSFGIQNHGTRRVVEKSPDEVYKPKVHETWKKFARNALKRIIISEEAAGSGKMTIRFRVEPNGKALVLGLHHDHSASISSETGREMERRIWSETEQKNFGPPPAPLTSEVFEIEIIYHTS